MKLAGIVHECFRLAERKQHAQRHDAKDLRFSRVRHADGKANLFDEHRLLQSEFAAGAEQFLPQLCPFIGELIQHLHDRGKILGVASGNLTTVGWAKITAAGLRAYFSFGAFCDGCEARADIVRAAIAQARKIAASAGPAATVCLVGDTPADIAAARANAIPVIAVATGTFSFAELLAGQPDLCLNSCADLRL